MDETREAALAYYASSKVFKDEVDLVFELLDTDGDKKISKEEFEQCMMNSGASQNEISRSFAELSRDGEPFLFEDDIKVLFYMIQYRDFKCRQCENRLETIYFSCQECFLKETYDLCVKCYKKNKFHHEHQLFADNHALLSAARLKLMKQEEEKYISDSEDENLSSSEDEDDGTSLPRLSKQEKLKVALDVAELGVAVSYLWRCTIL